MSIKLKWVDRNAVVDGFRIYRSTSPIVDGALPAPLADVGPLVFEYIDTTAARNVLYYYRISAYLAGEEVASINRALAFMPYTGPGPQTLIRGDYKAGFFGELLLEDIITVDDFRTLYGLSAWALAGVRPTTWLKFAVDGKILFWPNNGGFFQSITLTQVYAAGLMYGSNDSDLYAANLKSTTGIINQIRPLVKGDHVFTPRCPIARANRYDTANANLAGGELDLAISLAYLSRSATHIATYPGALCDYTHDGSYYYYTSDTYNGTTAHIRGAGSFDTPTAASLINGSTSYTYRPVLELQF